MQFEPEKTVFRRKRPDFPRLEKAGFSLREGGYEKEILFHGGDFAAQVRVEPDGSVRGKVIDAASGEEYEPLRISSQSGSYVSAVREEYREILEKICREGFRSVWFAADQSNRVAEEIRKEYGDAPDFPFSGGEKDAGVFRHPDSGKWYGILMSVPVGKIRKSRQKEPADILNLKSAAGAQQLHLAGVYPAYHMNHVQWITVVMDDTLDDEQVMALVRESWELTKK